MTRDLRALLEKDGATRASRGLAEAGAKLCQGAVYVVPKEPAPAPGRQTEKVVAFPELRLPGAGSRADHEYWVVVLPPSTLCDDDELNTVHVAPCSSSARGPCSSFDLDLSEKPFSKPNRAYVSIAQPVLKSDLTMAGLRGVVVETTRQAMLARWRRLQTG